jgi:hypothetical protein
MTTPDKIKPKEKQIAAASYFYAFYKEILNLSHYESQYINILAELKSKYNEFNLNKLGDDEKAAVIQQVQYVRFYARKCWIMYKTIIPALKIDEKEGLDEAYKQVKEVYIIDPEQLEIFVLGINSILVNSMIQELIDTSQSIIESIYSEDDGATEQQPGGEQEEHTG